MNPYPIIRKTDSRDELRGIGGGLGPGFNVHRVPIDKIKVGENITRMRDKMEDVQRYAKMFAAGSEPPALWMGKVGTEWYCKTWFRFQTLSCC